MRDSMFDHGHYDSSDIFGSESLALLFSVVQSFPVDLFLSLLINEGPNRRIKKESPKSFDILIDISKFGKRHCDDGRSDRSRGSG